jgi:hypothetical protein
MASRRSSTNPGFLTGLAEFFDCNVVCVEAILSYRFSSLTPCSVRSVSPGSVIRFYKPFIQNKKKLWRKPILYDMIAPLAPALLPPEVGGACDAPVLPVHKFATFLCAGNAALLQPGRHERAGRSPGSVSYFFNNFYRAGKKRMV